MNLKTIILNKRSLTYRVYTILLLLHDTLEKVKLESWKIDQWLPGTGHKGRKLIKKESERTV